MKRIGSSVKFLLSLAAISLGLITSGCSQRWIEADSGISSDEVLDKIADIREVNSLSSNASQFDEIVETEGSYIYYTEGTPDSPMGPAQVAAGLLSFSFMSDQAADLRASDLEEAYVIYVEDGDRASLLIQILPSGDSAPISIILDSVEAPELSDSEYSVVLGRSGQPVLRLSTFHTTENDLQGNVKFQVYDYTEDGEEQWLGQFGAMVGYF